MSKKLAQEILKDMYLENSDDELIVAVMLEFAKTMCELQKQVCAENAIIEITDFRTHVDKESILNSKNVCDEH